MIDAAVLRNAPRIQALGGGKASSTWLVELEDGLAVLREDHPLARRLGLDRKSEWQVLNVAHSAGIGPEPLFVDPDEGILVTRYLPGEPWAPESMKDPAQLELLGRLLRSVHELPRTGKVFDPLEVAERYARESGNGQEKKLQAVSRLAGDLYEPGADRYTCHGDPNAANIIGGSRVRLIDWEYASVNDPLFDLAVVVRYHALDRNQSQVLLTAWSGETDGTQMERLQAFCRLYDLLAGLWQQVVSNNAPL